MLEDLPFILRTHPDYHAPDFEDIVKTRNSSGDEIANVNFLCDIVHALKIQ